MPTATSAATPASSLVVRCTPCSPTTRPASRTTPLVGLHALIAQSLAVVLAKLSSIVMKFAAVLASILSIMPQLAMILTKLMPVASEFAAIAAQRLPIVSEFAAILHPVAAHRLPIVPEPLPILPERLPVLTHLLPILPQRCSIGLPRGPTLLAQLLDLRRQRLRLLLIPRLDRLPTRLLQRGHRLLKRCSVLLDLRPIALDFLAILPDLADALLRCVR